MSHLGGNSFFSGNNKNRLFELVHALGSRTFFVIVIGLVFTSVLELANVYFIYSIFEVINFKKNSVDLSISSLFFISVEFSFFLKIFSGFIFIYFLSVFFSAFIVSRYSYSAASRLSTHILEVKLNSSEMLQNIPSSHLVSLCLNDAQRVGSGIILSALNILSRSSIIILIALFLFFLNGYLASVAFVVLVVIYGGGYLFMRPLLNDLGSNISSTFQERSRLLGFASSAFRSEVIGHRRDALITEFSKQTKVWSAANVWIATISVVPRACVELGILVICLGLGVYFWSNADSSEASFEHYIPQLAAFGVAFMRIYPSFQQLFANLVNFKASIIALENIAVALERSAAQKKVLYWKLPVLEVLPPDVILECKNMQVELGHSHTIKCPDFTLKKNSVIVLRGPSGVGKSTIIDSILGLRPTQYGYANWTENLNGKIQFIASEPFFFGSHLEQEMKWRGISRHQGFDSKFEELWKDFGLSNDLLPSCSHCTLYFASLSRGERQRVSIILSILQSPRVLVLDEALSGCGADLEVSIVDKVLLLGVSMLVVSHSRHIAEKFPCVQITDSR